MTRGLSRLSKSEEGYLEIIYILTKEKGFANVVDIAEMLKVKPPSVTHMIQKLNEQKFVDYNKYRGVTLTKKGLTLAKSMEKYHKTLRSFFINVLGVDENIANEDACEIEHHIHPDTIDKFTKFLEFIENAPNNPKWLKHFRHFAKTGEYPTSCDEEILA